MKCKSDLRRAVVGKRNALAPAEIARRSARAARHLFSLAEVEAARTIMFFVTFASEVDTIPMVRRALSKGKRVLAPRADPARRELTPCRIQDLERDLTPGAHAIREPASHCPAVCLDEIDVVIVPAAVWSEDGYRTGYGAGYYDRFLPRLPGAVRIGLGLEVQVVPEAPHEAHDLPVDILVTEAGIRRFPHRRRGNPHGR
jgi:5-formyltetrahydrofolate cyclo-ligase